MRRNTDVTNYKIRFFNDHHHDHLWGRPKGRILCISWTASPEVQIQLLKICLKWYVNGSKFSLNYFAGSLKGTLKRNYKRNLKGALNGAFKGILKASLKGSFYW